jgi:UDP-N-acetylmuramate dehydrogenase
MAPSEFFSGIPGSLGGALTMNAGAYGYETWDTVESVKVITRKGELIERHPPAYKVRYRKVEGPENEWFVSAKLAFDPKKSASISKQKEMLSKRNISQPLGKPSCGSVFKNPKGDYAARLIQEAGLKGYSIGGGKISEKHANFIINENDALASDIESLIIYVKKEIHQKFNIKLQCEVRIAGKK